MVKGHHRACAIAINSLQAAGDENQVCYLIWPNYAAIEIQSCVSINFVNETSPSFLPLFWTLLLVTGIIVLMINFMSASVKVMSLHCVI